MTHRAVELAGDTDVAGFRRAARSLLSQGVAPDFVSWHVAANGRANNVTNIVR